MRSPYPYQQEEWLPRGKVPWKRSTGMRSCVRSKNFMQGSLLPYVGAASHAAPALERYKMAPLQEEDWAPREAKIG